MYSQELKFRNDIFDVIAHVKTLMQLRNENVVPVVSMIVIRSITNTVNMISPKHVVLDVANPINGPIPAICDIIDGLSFLHQHRIAHGALSTKSLVVVTRDFSPAVNDYIDLSTGIVRIHDYGLVGSVIANQCIHTMESRYEHHVRNGIAYRAPEQIPYSFRSADDLSDDSADNSTDSPDDSTDSTDSPDDSIDMLAASDIYALAVIVCTLHRRTEPNITQKNLCKVMTKLLKTNERPEHSEIRNWFPVKFCDFILRCWAKDATSRPSIGECKQIVKETFP